MKRRIAVIGLGTFGQELARRLSLQGCEVLAIDRDLELVEGIAEHVTKAAAADARDRDALRELGVDECDCAVLALRGHVESSVLALIVLQEIGVKEIVAQAVSEDHRRALLRLGATRVIFPDKDIAERTAQTLVSPDLLDYTTLAPGYGLSELETPPSFVGKSIVQANVRQAFGVNIAAVRNRQAGGAAPSSPSSSATAKYGLPFVPPPNYEFKAGDHLICLGRTEDLRRLAELE